MNKTVELNVNGTPLAFDVTLDAFNAYLNAMQPTDKVNPSHNFLMRTVQAQHKDDLKELLAIPGACLEIAGSVLEEYKPNVSITVGK